MSVPAAMRRVQEREEERLAEADREAGRPASSTPRGYIDPRSKRPAVPHGLRSSFRDREAECTSYPGEMAEVALARRISNAVEAACRRGDQIEKRRAMMEDWARFLGSARS